jgi:hypothetical protein
LAAGSLTTAGEFADAATTAFDEGRTTLLWVIHTDAIWTGSRSLRSEELSPKAGRIDLGWVGLEQGQVDREAVSNAEDQVQESDDGEHPEHRREPGSCPAEGARQAGSNTCIQP